jgi:hypothetical protein
MAFALSIKSVYDFPEVGPMFLLLTLIITAFTLIYSSIFLETTLNKCGIVIKEEEQGFEENHSTPYSDEIDLKQKNIFDLFKDKMENINSNIFLPLVERDQIQNIKGLKANLLHDFQMGDIK